MIISKTPLRISFFGGGTDFVEFYSQNKSLVLSTTINKYCYVFLRRLQPFFCYKNEVIYSKIERVPSIDSIEHPLVREALKYKKISGVHLAYDADLPARSGLATSSAFSVGMLNALNAFSHVYVTKEKIALEAIYLERILCNEKGGIQDQVACSFGGLNFIIMDKEGFCVQPVTISDQRKQELESNLMLFFTGRTRISSNIQTSINPSDIKTKGRLNKLREFSFAAKEILLNEKIQLSEFGRLLNLAWTEKRELSGKISTDEINEIYDRGLQAGALGGKLLGAGGGGFLLFYVPPGKRSEVKKALRGLLEIPFKFEEDGSKIIFYDTKI